METSEHGTSPAPPADAQYGAGAVAIDDPVAATWREPEPVVTEAVAGTRADRVPQARLRAALVVWDALLPAALLPLCAQLERVGGTPLNGGAAGAFDKLTVLLTVTSLPGLAIAGAYQHRRRREGSRLAFALRLLVLGMVLSWLALTVSAAAGWPVDSFQMAAMAVALPVGWLVGRWACDRHPASGVERVLLVGSGEMARRVLELTRRHHSDHVRIVGRIDGDAGSGDPPAGDPPLLGDYDQLAAIVESEGVDRLIVAFAPGRDTQLLGALREAVARGVQVDVVPRFFDLTGPSPRAHAIGDLALLEVPGRGLDPGRRALKRSVDIVGAGTLVVLLAPVLAAVALAVAVRDGRPVLYRQTRIGRHGREFSILKFRSMRPEPDILANVGGPISDVVRDVKQASTLRVTPLGGFLRRTSLDELPQLLNVVKGDMSLVGPRPLRPFEVEALDPWQQARQELRPGLTGLWQVLGRSSVHWDERMQLDYSYVAHWSLLSDLRILARTLPAVLKRDGAV